MDLGDNEEAKKYFEMPIFTWVNYTLMKVSMKKQKDILKYLQMMQIHIQSIC